MNDDLISRQAAIDAIFSEPLYESGMKKRDADAVVPAIYEKIKSLPPAQPEQRWIPVSERLPGYGEKVLVTFRNKYIGRTTIGISRCYIQKEGFFSDQPFDYTAVAWMPLPQPWEGENDG